MMRIEKRLQLGSADMKLVVDIDDELTHEERMQIIDKVFEDVKGISVSESDDA